MIFVGVLIQLMNSIWLAFNVVKRIYGCFFLIFTFEQLQCAVKSTFF